MKLLKVLAVGSEIFPLVKTGGLADVVGAMPAALSRESIRVKSIVPGYPAVLAALAEAPIVLSYPDLFGGPAHIRSGQAGALDILVLDAPHLFDRPGGNPYIAPDGRDWPDNALRFAALSFAAADVGLGQLRGYAPDLVHGHDWQAGLTFAYLRYHNRDRPRPRSVFTIHNLAFQGQFSAAMFPALGLPPAAFALDGIEYYGGVGYLKAGLEYADRVTTVSPNYAAEIRTPEAGMGLDGMIRARGGAVSGILNGIDTDDWNPAVDRHLVSPFDAGNIEARAANKLALQERMGLDRDAESLLFGIVSRLTWQKGVDLLMSALSTIVGLGAQLAVLGSGDRELEAMIVAAAAANPGRIGCFIGYDESLAHQIQAGADVVLVPSRFEPCGLTQLYALRYGAIPLVARVGGLSDTVIDANPAALARGVATGLQFAPTTEEMLRVAIERAVALYRQPKVWRRLQANGMASDVSWRGPAHSYAALFRDLVASRR